MRNRKISYKKVRTLIHGGKYANVVNHQTEVKTQNERMRLAELAGKSIIVDRSKLPLPNGKYGKLMVHNKTGETKTINCFENHITQYLEAVKEPASGMYCGKKFEVMEDGGVNWIQ